MDLNNIRPAEGSTKNRKRIGRGPGSGHGKTSTKGHKGQKARSGGSIKAGFEGGQMPMQRRLPKRGFTSLFKKEFVLVKLSDLDAFPENTVVTLEVLRESGLLSKLTSLVKILADGELTKPLTVSAHKFSATAREKIVAAGGTLQELPF
ncbi:MAG: 50S ribosomal protein L15 [Geobacteraceae bacterium]|nr:50S ribosomal protein L15 [Geobacteraceae bacterium]